VSASAGAEPPPPGAEEGEERTRAQFGGAPTAGGPGPGPAPQPPTRRDPLAAAEDDRDAGTARALPLPPGPSPAPASGEAGRSAGWATIRPDGRLEPGQVVFGRYLVKGPLGRGGMGTVWRVQHLALGADRALKLIVGSIAFDPEARARFAREGRAMARFSHPNAVAVHDAQVSGDVAFLEMEYVPGKSLDTLLGRGQPLPLDCVARLLRQLGEALQVAHESGIVHRDLKPSNLMLVDGRPPGREQLKVLDFGIAKVLGGDESEGDLSTRANTFMGTPPYCSPEQATGGADPRSDIYSVGVILFEMLTGHRPFSGPVAKQVADTLHTPPPAFRAVNPKCDVPPAVEAVVRRCLEKNPLHRPQTAMELVEAFEAALPGAATTRPRRPIARSVATAAVMAAGAFALALLASRPWTDRTPASPRPGVTPPLAVPLPAGYSAVDVARPGALPDVLIHDATGMRFHRLDGGTFELGATRAEDDPEPPRPRPATVRTFYLAETEVTNGAFRRYLRETTARPPPTWQEAYDRLRREHGLDEAEADRHPAVGLDHATAARFARWLGGRLPTSAEWEYAAQSGGLPEHPYVWGARPAPDVGGTEANLDSADKPGPPTTRAGQFNRDRNAQGIVDLAGNVREWCADAIPGSDPPAAVVRGGSWRSIARRFGTSAFAPLPVAESLNDLGARVALDPPPAAPKR
jgi:formylglycine-generating enzyme required for sulfatase activity